MKKFNCATWRFARTSSILLVGFTSCIYLNYFFLEINNFDWLEAKGFARILIPDTYLYLALIDEDDLFKSLVFSGIKNTLGPSLIWYVAQFNWHLVVVINVFFVFLTVSFMEKIANYFDAPVRELQFSILLFLAMPILVYYSIGALKELPMMALVTMVVYFWLKERFFYLLICVIVLALFRFQMAFLVLFLYLIALFRLTLRQSIILVCVCLSFYPFFNSLDILSHSTTQYYRDEYGQSGSVGEVVEVLRDNFPVISTFAIGIRVIQSIFEPLISFLNFGIYETENVSVIVLVQFVTLIMIIPYFFIFLKKIIFMIRNDSNSDSKIQLVYVFVLYYMVLVGGISFIHHRYLVPIFPIVILLALIPIRRVESHKNE